MFGYEGLVWVNDKDGNELVCTLDRIRKIPRKLDELSEHERSSCRDIKEILNTERW